MIDLKQLVDLAIEAGAARQRTHVTRGVGKEKVDEAARAADRKLALAHAQLGDQLGELVALVREARTVMEPESSVTPVDDGPSGWTARAVRVLKGLVVLRAPRPLDHVRELAALVREACPRMKSDAFGNPTDIGPTGWTARAVAALAKS